MRRLLIIFAFFLCSTAALVVGQENPSTEDNAVAGEDGVRGFVGVEPFEVRLEALAEVAPYAETWRIEGDEISRSERDAVLDNLVTLFESGVTLKSPDAAITYSDRLVRFVRRDLEKGFVEDDRDPIPLSDALVGITFSSNAAAVSELEIEWLWFAPEQDKVTIEIASRGSPAARYATPEKNTVRWKQDGKVEQPAMLAIPKVIKIEKRPLLFLIPVGLALLVWGAVVVLRAKQKSTARVGWIIVAGLACGIVAMNFQITGLEKPDAEATDEIVYNLLRNTYHAFDFRDESAIYDTLEDSISGPLLEKVYLEIRSSLELENSGGPRVRVYEIALREATPLTDDMGESTAFRARAEWVTIGEVTHWGHTHERTNKYEADLTVSGRDSQWKISGLELLNEERVQKVSRRAGLPASASPEL